MPLLRDQDRVVLPAHNEEATIGDMIAYLHACGVRSEQIVVVDSHSTDETGAHARRALNGSAHHVISQEHTLARYASIMRRTYGFGSLPGGKGAAMYAGIVHLMCHKTPDDARVVFLDADITNAAQIQLLETLLQSWKLRPNARVAKLASYDRDNQQVVAYLNALPEPYREIAWFTWPLSGQQAFYFGDLCRAPIPCGYGVELGLLSFIVEQYGVEGFSQSYLSSALREHAAHPVDEYVVMMYTRIFLLMQQILRFGGLNTLSPQQIQEWNAHDRSRQIYFDGGQRTHFVEALLPPARWLKEY